jgi:acetoin utilization deacetylase AcuC-like enzyme
VPPRAVRALVRSLRRQWHLWRKRGVPLVYDPRYRQSVLGVPLHPERGENVLTALEEAGLLKPSTVSEPRPASFENLLRVHSAAYLGRLQDPATLTRILGVPVPPSEAEATLELQRLMVGGTIHATRLALRTGGVAVHLGGGFHHAMPEDGHGFCVFNDVAVAIARLRSRGYTRRMLVVDLDLHDGNGTRAIFREDPSVHTFSIHNEHWGATEAVASTSLALGPDVEDARYLATLREALPPVLEQVRPRLVYYVAGSDLAADDALGNWRLSGAAILERDRFVTGLMRSGPYPRPMVVVLAGGYGPHAWRHTARYVLWLAAGRELEPLEEELLLVHRPRLQQALRTAEGASPTGFDFTLTEEDLVGVLPGYATPPRFLGLLTRHGAELLLESAGILPELRRRGYPRLVVELDPRNGSSPTLRVRPEEDRDAPLIELRAERSRGIVTGMELVSIEWLLLQNPRSHFTDRRPQLPGQRFPGLGLLRDVMGCLVVACETHGLDGIHFVAAHYHVAIQSRRVVRPILPADEARLRALAQALEGLALPEATAAVEAGRIVDAATGEPVPWSPLSAVLPVSERLKERVGGAEYEEAVAREGERLRYRLVPAPALASARA